MFPQEEKRRQKMGKREDQQKMVERKCLFLSSPRRKLVFNKDGRDR